MVSKGEPSAYVSLPKVAKATSPVIKIKQTPKRTQQQYNSTRP